MLFDLKTETMQSLYFKRNVLFRDEIQMSAIINMKLSVMSCTNVQC